MITTFCSVLAIAFLKGTFLKLFVSGEDRETRKPENGQIDEVLQLQRVRCICVLGLWSNSEAKPHSHFD
jgi:hypothetical protein